MLPRPQRQGNIFAADRRLLGDLGPVCYLPHLIAGNSTCNGVLDVSTMKSRVIATGKTTIIDLHAPKHGSLRNVGAWLHNTSQAFW